MIERRRLPSATYHSPSDESWTRDLFADQMIAVHQQQHNSADVARHVADRQVSRAPFFVMDVQAVLRSVQQWNLHLARFEPHYALRCNADPVLAQILAETHGMGFEVTNARELATALTLVNPSRVIYNSPLWTRKAMRMAGEACVGTVVVSSEKELYDAVSYAPEAKILIAIAVGHPVCEAVASNTGCSTEEAEELLTTAFQLRANVVGFSFNVDNRDTSVYFKALREVRQLFDIARACGLSPSTVCVGGGFRPPQQKDKRHFYEICEALYEATDMYLPAEQFPRVRFLATPGRFFATSAFSLCTNVIGKREIDQQTLSSGNFEATPRYIYQTNDGIYGSFGCRLAEVEPECQPLHERCLDSQENAQYGVVLGPTLDQLDIAQKLFLGRQLSVGEWLLWENMGAYSMPSDEDCPSHPVYYFSGKDHWDRIVNKRNLGLGELEVISDSASDGASDAASVTSDEDDVDLITRFDNFFDY